MMALRLGRRDGLAKGWVQVLVVPKAGLVFLSNPKTATQSIRAMLRPASLKSGPYADLQTRHMGVEGFELRWRAKVEQAVGRPVETVAVVREPFARLESWFRYRKRNPAGDPKSTQGVGFDAFARAAVLPDPPEYAKVGDQARFCGWEGGEAVVTHLFDYDRMDLLLAFLSARIGRPFTLPKKNLSPRRDEVEVEPLAEDTATTYRAARAGEFALHAAVSARGHLSR